MRCGENFVHAMQRQLLLQLRSYRETNAQKGGPLLLRRIGGPQSFVGAVFAARAPLLRRLLCLDRFDLDVQHHIHLEAVSLAGIDAELVTLEGGGRIGAADFAL